MMFLALSFNRRHEKVPTNRGLCSIFAVSELLGALSEPLESLGNLLKMTEITFLARVASQYPPLVLCYLPHAHSVLDQGGVDDQALVVFRSFCKPRANSFGLKSFSVLHMQCFETMVPLHRSWLVVIWLPNDLCILIVNFLCNACNFPLGWCETRSPKWFMKWNPIWRLILVVVWQLFGFVILNDFYHGISLLKQRGVVGEYEQRLLYQTQLSNTGSVSATVGTQTVKSRVWIWGGSVKHAVLY